MTPIEPNLESELGHDALRVWLDFWELTGRLRIDIVRRSKSNGDPAKLIQGELTETVIPSVPAILVGRNLDGITDRAGVIPSDTAKLEFIDVVRKTDRLRLNTVDYEVDWVQEKDMGDFAVYLVQAHRIE
jgi:hypothetical protein